MMGGVVFFKPFAKRGGVAGAAIFSSAGEALLLWEGRKGVLFALGEMLAPRELKSQGRRRRS